MKNFIFLLLLFVYSPSGREFLFEGDVIGAPDEKGGFFVEESRPVTQLFEEKSGMAGLFEEGKKLDRPIIKNEYVQIAYFGPGWAYSQKRLSTKWF